MGAQTEGPSLAALLDRRRREIANAWIERVLPFIAQAFLPDSPALYGAIAQLDACLRRIIRLHAHLYGQLMERRVEEQQGRTALMLHVAQTASSSLGLDRVLNRIVEGMKTAVGCGTVRLRSWMQRKAGWSARLGQRT